MLAVLAVLAILRVLSYNAYESAKLATGMMRIGQRQDKV
jgi:hypothetical protein